MSRHHSTRDAARLRALFAAIVLGVVAAPVQAETGTANASDVAVHIDVLGIASLDVDPQAPTGFTGVNVATNVNASFPGLDVSNVAVSLTSSTINSMAEFLPGAGTTIAASTNTVENLNLSAVGLLGTSLLTISADAVDTQSEVTGWCPPPVRGPQVNIVDDITFDNGFDNGNLTPGIPGATPTEGVTLDNLGISILGIQVPALPTNPAPNTTIDLAPLGIVGATLVLNEQAIAGDGINWSSMSSNAVHLTLDVAGLITADVTVGHSDSMLDCTQ